MSLTTRQIELLKDNWKEVKENNEKVISQTYRELRERNSDFPLCDYESDGSRFIRAFDMVMSNLKNLDDEKFVSESKSLGFRHSQLYNTYEIMYPVMRDAWIAAIEKTLGPTSKEMKEAWFDLWNKVAQEMISGMERR